MPICQICKKSKPHFYHKINHYSYYFCKNCTTLFLHPKPPSQDIIRYYKQQFTYSAGGLNEKLIRQRAKLIIGQLLLLNPKGKTLIDIGSGYGFFVNEARRHGLSAIGIEPSKKLYPTPINRIIGVNIKNVSFEQFYLKNKTSKYDFITMIHTIEHIPNPQTLILKATKLLKPGGILYLETPNLDSHLFYTEKFNYTFLTPPDHIWLLSQKSFQLLLKTIPNINVVKISTYSYPEHFMGIVKTVVKKYFNVILGTTLSIQGRTQESDSGCDPKIIAYQNDKSKFKKLKYLLFDQLLAPLFTPILNIGNNGSILELYIKKK